MHRVSNRTPRGGSPAARAISAVAGAYRTAVIAGRWIIVGVWIAVLVLLSLLLPSSGGGGGGDIGTLLPSDSPAVAVQERSLQQFDVPVLSQTSVVVHDPAGLDPLTRADVALWALAHVQASQRGDVPPGPGQIVAAIPIPTATPNTAVTYLYLSTYTSLAEGTRLAQQYAAHFHNQASVATYVTGIAPAQYRQGYYLQDRIGVFELATLVLIALVVAVVFRSVAAPVVVLVVAGLGYLVALRLLAVLANALGFALPDQLQPLLAALLIGVVTDYCVLFFFAFRDQLRVGHPRRDAARRATASEGHIIAVAGLTVAAGAAALLAANFPLFRAFGPAMSLTVLIGLAVSLTLVPALMAILGRGLFLPWRAQGDFSRSELNREAGRLIRWVTRRRGALIATVLSLSALALATAPLTQLRLDLSFSSGLPDDDEVQVGAQTLEGSGIRGVTAPTEVIVEGTGIAGQRAALDRFQAALDTEPGVAAVLGPAQNPLTDNFGVVYSRTGDAARFVVILDSDPLGATAIATLDRLTDRLDDLADRAGVENATVAVTGQTAIAAELDVITRENLRITLVAALLVELLILVLYLRALAAPVVLLACSALGVSAALGLTVLVFQVWRGDPGLVFFTPFATAVLLLALGSDYNVFTVGAIWERAASHPLRRAIELAMPATSRAVSAAGIILAATFAMVAIIPLETFRQVAFTMSVGLLIDTFLIRPVLTPAVLTLLGRAAGWPSRRIRTAPTEDEAPTQDEAPTEDEAPTQDEAAGGGPAAARRPVKNFVPRSAPVLPGKDTS